jgi:hypothetical protein
MGFFFFSVAVRSFAEKYFFKKIKFLKNKLFSNIW